MRYADLDELSGYKVGATVVYLLDMKRAYPAWASANSHPITPGAESKNNRMLVIQSTGNLFVRPDFKSVQRPNYGIVDYRAGKPLPEGWALNLISPRDINSEWDWEAEMEAEPQRKIAWDRHLQDEKNKRRAGHIKQVLSQNGVKANAYSASVTIQSLEDWEKIAVLIDPNFKPAT